MFFAFFVRSGRCLGRTRRSWLLAPLLALSLGSPAACNTGGDDIFATDDDGGTSGSVRFAEEGALELLPSEEATIVIITEADTQIGVLLLGDALDASLDRTSIRANAEGRAIVKLRAPGQPSTFRLRAQVGDLASAELPVAVSDHGFSDVRVVPTYAGDRAPTEWVASILVGSSCETVLAAFPADPEGALRAESAAGELPVIGSVPVGPTIAVAIRSGAIVGGCTTTTLKTPGKIEELSVEVLDRPMDLGSADLEMTLGFSPDLAGWTGVVQESGARLSEAAFPEATPFATLLLDAMEAATLDPSDLVAFEDRRQQGALDTVLAQSFAGFHAFDVCSSYAAQGSALAASNASSTSSRIEARLKGSTEAPDMPTFKLTSFLGATASQVGAPEALPMTWSASPGDTLAIGGTLPFSSTRLAGFWMNAAAAGAIAPGATVPQAIEGWVDCVDVATQFGSFGDCTLECVELLCVAALESRWQTGLAADELGGVPTGSLQVAISGTSTVDAFVVPIDLAGTWVGTLSADGQSTSVAGAVVGATLSPL